MSRTRRTILPYYQGENARQEEKEYPWRGRLFERNALFNGYDGGYRTVLHEAVRGESHYAGWDEVGGRSKRYWKQHTSSVRRQNRKKLIRNEIAQLVPEDHID